MKYGCAGLWMLRISFGTLLSVDGWLVGWWLMVVSIGYGV